MTSSGIPLIDSFVSQFGDAAREAAILELLERILADKIRALEHLAHDGRLEEVEEGILRHFEPQLAKEDRPTLQACRQLRNKLFHGDFGAARKKLEGLGVQGASAGVKQVPIQNLKGAEILEQIRAAAEAVPGTFRLVSETTTREGGIFGWLLELGASRDLVLARDKFRQAIDIIHRLLGSC